jgi:hypothetical protein
LRFIREAQQLLGESDSDAALRSLKQLESMLEGHLQPPDFYTDEAE